MHSTFVVLLVASAAFATPSISNLRSWNQFKFAHNKVYDLQEEQLRFKIFSENLQEIEEHNALFDAGLKTYKKGINRFSDLTHGEFLKYLTLSGPQPIINGSIHVTDPNIAIPESVDYRQQGAVNPVRDQGYCGSCWAFSAVGTVESINYLRTGNLLALSEQNLVDCSTTSHGCNGGFPHLALEYIRDNGLETQDEYPYIASQETCKFSPSKSVVRIKGYKRVEKSEDALKSAVGQVGPVSVGVDGRELMSYESGIFIAQNPDPAINHAMVVVGYGSENGLDYWIVRNSWNAEWGEQGYIRIARNYNNQVLIANQVAYPEI